VDLKFINPLIRKISLLPITSSLWSPDIFLNTLFSDTLNLCSTLREREREGGGERERKRRVFKLHVHIYLSIYLSIYLWLYSPLLDLGRFFCFLILYKVGRTPWTGDQPVARSLPTHGTT
jgi:hypothetical protein